MNMPIASSEIGIESDAKMTSVDTLNRASASWTCGCPFEVRVIDEAAVLVQRVGKPAAALGQDG